MKRTIIIIVLVVTGIAAWYGFTEWNRKNPDLSKIKADQTTDALSLIAAFQKDTASANKQYIDKIVAVTGTLKKIESEENPVILFLGDDGEMSSVQCSMDSSHALNYAALQPGSTITIKGKCNGYQYDDLLGTDVKLNRCVMESKQ